MSNTSRAVTGIVVALVIAALCWPITTACPHGPCSTAPDSGGHVHRYYEVAPFAAPVIELISGQHWRPRYSSGIH